MDKRNAKGWLYLLPAIAFLGVFMVYPLVDVFVYSFEEGTTPRPRRFPAWVCSTTAMCCGIPTFCRR